MTSIRILFPFLLLFLNGWGDILQAQGQTLTYGRESVLHSGILDEDRKLLIHTPPGYDEGDQSYPVLYLLDGEAHFFHGSGIAEYLARLGYMPEVIVVGIVNTDRTRDFSPVAVESEPTSGGADHFMAFLEKELFPFVEKEYRTQPFRILEGHSFGGTFAVYTLIRKPDLFQAYIAISPYLHYSNSYLLTEAKNNLRSRFRSPKYFFMCVANEAEYYEPLKQFAALLRERCGKNISFDYQIFDKETHMSVPHLGIYYGLKHIFSAWVIPDYRLQAGLASVEAFYAGLSEKYGYSVEVTEAILNRLGYLYLQNNDFKNATEIFLENTRRYPGSPNAWDSLGEAYERSGNAPAALECYRKAFELAQSTGSPNRGYFKANMDRLENRSGNQVP
ncbi:MAG: alpha/beta hydrolase-fold protein [Bacteroidota bacterium]